MKEESPKIIQLVKKPKLIDGIRMGRIVRINESGAILVDFPGNGSRPVDARITTSAKENILRKGNPVGRQALLALENNDPGLPVIIDAMHSLIEEMAESAASTHGAEELQDVTIDGKRISFEAGNEIELKCGKASITLTRAGKVIIKGEYVLSESSGKNITRGGSITSN